MDILFLGGVYPKHLEEEIVKNTRGIFHFAANNLQWGLIDGLDICNGNPVRMCNFMIIGSYPKGFGKLIIKNEEFAHQPGSSDINLGFINLPYIKLFFELIACTKFIQKWANSANKHKVIIVYGIHTPFLLASRIAKKIHTDVKLCLVAPDLPQFMSDSKNLLYRTFKFVDRLIIDFCLKEVDSFVLLSDFMTEQLNITPKPWVRVEGIFDSKKYEFIINKNPFKTIMYSGNLDTSQGIPDLLSAFSGIKEDNYRLWITGSGNGLPEVLKAAQTDKRITYFSVLGQIELFKLQQMSTLLVNPLKSQHKKTRYFFPSKTMEYMASGVPTLMYKLPCIPQEYHNHLIFFKDYTVEGMCNMMVGICEKPKEELVNFGMEAREFILNYKNPEVQCRKIYSMLNKLFN